jgi:Chaperone of endosialidase/Head domain of trimeric autotransporter adhesin
MKNKLKQNTELGGARHSVRAAVRQIQPGAHGVARPTWTPWLLLGLLTSVLCLPAAGQNTVVTYQGRVTDHGTNFNGAGQFKFALVTSTNNNHTATANAPVQFGFVLNFFVTDGGNGYSVAPTVTVTGGGGSGAAASANISGGVVTSLNFISGGSNYTSNPTITISPPPANIVMTTYWSNDGASSGGNEPATAVSTEVTSGLFTVGLGDTTLANMTALNAALFQRTDLQLRIWFSDGVNGFAALSPLQNLTAAPYANYAYAATTLTTGNNQPLNLTINGTNVLRIESVFDSVFGSFTVNSLGGYAGNTISNGFVGGFIGGGGNSIAPNRVGANYASVLGGRGNTASGYASTAMGFVNTASGQASTAMGFNTTTSGDYSTAMGLYTTASGYSATALGNSTTASGNYSTAMGSQSKALHAGTFVWADTQFPDFASTGDNQFCVRANGGVQLNPDTSLFFGSQTRQMINLFGTEYGIGVQGATEYFRSVSEFNWFRGGVHDDAAGNAGAGGTRTMNLDGGGNLRTLTGVISSLSDRNAKTNFEPVDARDVLERVAALPITRWNFKTAPATQRHLGPMAQDFYAAFNIGLEDTGICTVDADGVALAAIQGLNQKLEVRGQKSEDRFQKLETENAELKQRLQKLEQLMNHKLNGGAQ